MKVSSLSVEDEWRLEVGRTGLVGDHRQTAAARHTLYHTGENTAGFGLDLFK